MAYSGGFLHTNYLLSKVSGNYVNLRNVRDSRFRDKLSKHAVRKLAILTTSHPVLQTLESGFSLLQ